MKWTKYYINIEKNVLERYPIQNSSERILIRMFSRNCSFSAYIRVALVSMQKNFGMNEILRFWSNFFSSDLMQKNDFTCSIYLFSNSRQIFCAGNKKLNVWNSKLDQSLLIHVFISLQNEFRCRQFARKNDAHSIMVWWKRKKRKKEREKKNWEWLREIHSLSMLLRIPSKVIQYHKELANKFVANECRLEKVVCVAVQNILRSVTWPFLDSHYMQ